MSIAIKSQQVARTNARGPHRAKQLFVGSAMTPLLLYMLFWTLFPMLWAVVLAFFDYSATRNGGAWLGLGGDNPFIAFGHFKNMFGVSLEAKLFRTSFKNTIIFAFMYLPLNLLVTIPLALAIEAVHQHLKTVFRFIYFLPTVTASVGVALIWGYLYHPQQGLVNTIIKALGGHTIIWMNDPRKYFLGISLTMWSLVIAYLWSDLGYNLIIFIAALQGIPKDFREAAMVDGANTWQLFWRITLPLLRPTLLFVCVLTMISSFQVFDIIQIMTQGGPQDQTRVLVLDIYENAFRFQRMGWAGAASLVLFALIFVVTLVQRRLLRTQWEY
ncbi:MAG: sugar ABC transporter permease [Caldilineaceae bacterium]